MLGKPSFAIGLVAAAAAVAWPPMVFLAFALVDHAYVRAGQEVPLS